MAAPITDSPCGMQFVVIFKPPNDPGRLHWSAVYDVPEEARKALVRIRANTDPDAELFVRDVSRWAVMK